MLIAIAVMVQNLVVWTDDAYTYAKGLGEMVNSKVCHTQISKVCLEGPLLREKLLFVRR